MTTPATPQKCGTCNWWTNSFERRNDYDEGSCRRRAPFMSLRVVLGSHDDTAAARWPVVRGRDWCGDWQQAPSRECPSSRGRCFDRSCLAHNSCDRI